MKQFIVGVDVSKATLDFFFKPTHFSMRVSNCKTGFRQWIKLLDSMRSVGDQALVIMEHTGRYSYRFESFLRAHDIAYCKIGSLQIKRSLGVIRGKNDKVDAERIAEYGWLRREVLKADHVISDTLRELQDLLNLRLKLVRDRSGYINRFKEMKASGSCTKSDYQGKLHLQTIAFFTRHIVELEKKIKGIIASDTKLQTDCDLLRSIKGVGWIIACYMICRTEGFTRFCNARKFNCYAGIAPFSHESGTSLKARSRVSHLANKEAKTLLNLAASSAIQHDHELKAYYLRKVAEGKSKMSCLNSVRAKLVARMFAVIKRQTPYIEMAKAA